MKGAAEGRELGSAPQRARAAAPRWLLFVHQLPSQPSNHRVRTWRRLQQLGAIPLKQAVNVLPDSPAAREDFEWLKTEVLAMGGDASVFSADNLDPGANDALVEEFRRSRQDAYGALAREIEQAARATRLRRRPLTRAISVGRQLDLFRDRLARIDAMDFFGSAGRDRAVRSLEDLARHTTERRRLPHAPSDATTEPRPSYRGRLWITRPRPGVDRMASAWLIRRFIDTDAKFGFAADRTPLPADAIAFDMFGVEFTHRGTGCTFETLCDVFGIRDSAVARLARIVHDVDLKDGRFGAADAPTVEALVDGLRLAHGDDDTLLSQGMALFESLYRAFQHGERPARPRAVASVKRNRRGSLA